MTSDDSLVAAALCVQPCHTLHAQPCEPLEMTDFPRPTRARTVKTFQSRRETLTTMRVQLHLSTYGHRQALLIHESCHPSHPSASE